MVNINTVYRTVLAIANKEQRGYIAPTEFNLYAQQAQREIFESYFFDDAHFSLNRKGMAATGTSDIKKIIQEKIDIFSRTGDATYSSDNSNFTLPTDLYRLGAVYHTTGAVTRQVPMIPHEDLHYTLQSPLMAPSTTFPKYTRSGNTITVFPTGASGITSGVTVHYVKEPSTPIWGYLNASASREPLYNQASSTNFELHNSEQYLLVEKILFYAGIQLREPDLIQSILNDEALDNQNKKQ